MARCVCGRRTGRPQAKPGDPFSTELRQAWDLIARQALEIEILKKAKARADGRKQPVLAVCHHRPLLRRGAGRTRRGARQRRPLGSTGADQAGRPQNTWCGRPEHRRGHRDPSRLGAAIHRQRLQALTGLPGAGQQPGLPARAGDQRRHRTVLSDTEVGVPAGGALPDPGRCPQQDHHVDRDIQQPLADRTSRPSHSS